MLDTEREYQALLNNAPVGIVYTKDKIITRHNIHFAKIFGFESSVILTRQSNRFITQHIGFSGAENRT